MPRVEATVAFVLVDWLEGHIAPDDRLLVEPLLDRGISVAPAQWDADEDWSAFDAVLLRSPWDYSERVEEFTAWLDAREGAGDTIWNPAPLVRWNMHKGYLRELEAKGVRVAPTAWAARGTDADLAALARSEGWERVVIKPAISAGARRTAPYGADDPEGAEALREILAGGDAMVQPFFDAIVDEGEYSFLFFGREYSHTVLKRPAAGDFRVQEHHGGSTIPVDPVPALIEQAARVLDHVDGDLLYARVDGIRDGDAFVLIELEIFEPVLYLAHDPSAPDRFADALAARL